MSENTDFEKDLKEEVEKIHEEAAEMKAEAHQIHEDAEEIHKDLGDLKDLEELKKFKEKYYYLAAEMENVRKRNERDREQLIKFGNDKVLTSMLEVVDNFDRTINMIGNDQDEKVKNICIGLEMVRTQFLDNLKKFGLEPVDSLGKIFDPNFHEAMGAQPAEGKEDQEIITEYQKGYVLNGRLLRAAKVIVAKND
ncbi:MAG: nucleotide exchange factor GrpE [Bdellovibrio sp. CG12_big_fil_rev_8_21_14_0_65_39_13]|nr:MAG: nucleotide exchange factor GrpE [Bdellovibrio sp. CG22_combo_CG10-13_8_21_14_all_39_27]PIQ62613.1 MAG: nucleotide exchange factor GrpE [Bdellovibrio sp. CG12_big_fil_rev_8_21_14_0_65_39_13]PIR36968.1 MAG: nucleotide exchange factor GrpE [Bdellovibrio sp. CG11_big_fil_rev_8_21_14_0_20_39_38]PJB53479.1 MAG: nucleotide exchange factor GrpE [Bdellovibrio sp. CG_4_9_14_3_um_filter_39_7]